MVVDIAMKWTKVLRTGGIGVRFMAVDRSTVMFNMQNGKEVTEVNKKICKNNRNTRIITMLKPCFNGLFEI